MRVKRARNGPKTEKMGQHGKSTRPGLPHRVVHMPVSIQQTRTRFEAIAHGRVPVKPKSSPIRKRPLLRVLKHSKAYINNPGGT